jgi:hypothetical protein
VSLCGLERFCLRELAFADRPPVLLASAALVATDPLALCNYLRFKLLQTFPKDDYEVIKIFAHVFLRLACSLAAFLSFRLDVDLVNGEF